MCIAKTPNIAPPPPPPQEAKPADVSKLMKRKAPGAMSGGTVLTGSAGVSNQMTGGTLLGG